MLFKAYLRAVTNTAIALGSVFGGAALVVDETWAYVAVFVLNAVFTGFAAFNSPASPTCRRTDGRRASRASPCCATFRSW